MIQKRITLLAVLLLAAFPLFAQDFAGQIENIYNSYVRPGLIALILIFVAVGGIANMGKIRKGGEQAVEGYIAAGSLALYPLIVFAIAEALNQILAKMG